MAGLRSFIILSLCYMRKTRRVGLFLAVGRLIDIIIKLSHSTSLHTPGGICFRLCPATMTLSHCSLKLSEAR